MGKDTKTEQASAMQSEKLHKLFMDGLKDIYGAEKSLVKVLPEMISKASSQPLIEALTHHLRETETQVTRLEEIFNALGEKAIAKKCVAMEGLVDEAKDILLETDEGVMRDAGIIAGAQKIEHYEIATYGTLRNYAELLGMEEAGNLLQLTLDEEKNADQRLTEVNPAELMVETGSQED